MEHNRAELLGRTAVLPTRRQRLLINIGTTWSTIESDRICKRGPIRDIGNLYPEEQGSWINVAPTQSRTCTEPRFVFELLTPVPGLPVGCSHFTEMSFQP